MSRALLFLLAAGCGGGSFCTREWCGIAPTDESIDACEEQIAPCSAADERLMNDYFDCIDQAGAMCGEDTTTGGDDGQAFATCATGLLGLSEACAQAFVGSASVTFSGTPTTAP